MPRKCNGNSMKQKNLLKIRLMRIQISIEDYVYNGKKMSASDAKGYLQEVSGYRALGIQDARFLQVIEKITRCMKGILEEQQEEAHSDNTNCPSPVYSLPDEDKMLFSQEPMNIDTTENLDDTTDLFDEDVESQQNVQDDVEIHRAMSELSIREDETQIFEECSQSILQNSEPEVVGKLGTPKPNFKMNQMGFQRKAKQDSNSNYSIFFDHNKPGIAAQKVATKNMQIEDDDIIFIEPTQPPTQHLEPEVAGILKKSKTEFKINEEFTKEPTQGFNTNNSIFTEYSTITQQKLAIKNVHFQDNDVIFVEPDPPIAKTKPVIKQKMNQTGTEKKTRRQKNSSKNEKKNETNKRNMKIYGNRKRVKTTDNKIKNNYQKQIEKPDKTVDNINALITSTKAEKNSKKSIAKDIQNPANIVDLHKRYEPNGNIYKKNTENYRSTVNIYNKSTENDLSWIENIRYVREVNNEEFERAFVEESFWDNLMFPSDWNDKDFDY